MSESRKYTAFDTLTVPLADSNLIEASAGTGKTYSIAILALRLLLEKSVTVDEILMVTFTNAAVAELEERIWAFVRLASKHVDGEAIEDEQIKVLVDRAVEKEGKREIQELLKSAVINLDEAAVMTIHGFCQQSLNEYAFETRQLFNAELVSDTSDIIKEAAQKFWREQVTGIYLPLLKALISSDFSQKSIVNILNGHLQGKNYIFYDEGIHYYFDIKKQKEFWEKIAKSLKILEEKKEELLQSVSNNKADLLEKVMNNRYAKKSFGDLIEQPEEFIEQLAKKKGAGYVKKLFAVQLEHLEQKEKANEKYMEELRTCSNELYSFAIQEISQNIHQHKKNLSLMSFDDMIDIMHLALTKDENQILRTKLQEKYKAVFIDEFQDTDRLQYEIFDKAFRENSILFYIGDPKQSIYAWRKADITTYFKARNTVDHVYGMNINYRSSSRLLEALNHFFLPEDEFDTFYYAGETDKISYYRVNAPNENKKGDLFIEQQPCIPVTISKDKIKKEITENVAAQILELLTNPNHYIINNGEQQQIKPSDIGVLVRSKKNGIAIKEELSRLGIPAVSVLKVKILESQEAKDLVYVLEAILYHNRSKVNRALMSVFTHWSVAEVQKIQEEEVIQTFRAYHEKWKKHGIYTAMMEFITDFNVRKRLLTGAAENGKRTITNLLHLLELLNKTENRQHFSPVELIDWLKLNIDKNQNAEDEWEQRIESDEEAVNIVTIHSSKGLQYKLVFAPDLDMVYGTRHPTISFKNEAGKYITANRNQVDETIIDLHKKQEEQENRRLLYVALTRAVYKCFIYKSKSKKSTLAAFTEVLIENDVVQFEHFVSDEDKTRFQGEKSTKPGVLKARDFHLKENNWLKMSYSALAAHPYQHKKKLYSGDSESYDAFVFKKLRRGAKTGTFLHHIFEVIDFTKPEFWSQYIQRALKSYMPQAEDSFEKKIFTLLEQVLNAEIYGNNKTFRMSAIMPSDCLSEMEFNFPVSLFTPAHLTALREDGIEITETIWGQIEGIVNGYIDLFFRYEGKYYILDWKSNYLGSQVADYAPKYLDQAMTESNYHLQYLLYTYAAKKYLESRLGDEFNYETDFGGVLYLFLRGMREGERNGVFYTKPDMKQLRTLERIFEKEGRVYSNLSDTE